MKTKILKLLRNTTGYISGQELCEKMGVSRTAIWKVMNQLKEEGYEIHSVSNKGYQLVKSPDQVTAYAVGSYLETKELAKEIHYFKEIDSTNKKAKELANEQDPHGMLVIAEAQHAGRGRRGRNWESPAGSGIWMSLILQPHIMPEHASMLTLVTAMAVVKAVKKETGLETGIKWPNDVVLNHKKVCGILTEMSCELDYIHYVVIGIGVNANTYEFPEELQEVATSLAREKKERINRASLIAVILKEFEYYYEKFIQTEDMSLLEAEYNSMLVHRECQVRIIGPEEYQAIAKGIDNKGQLVVQCEDGEIKTVLSGEVSVRGINGYCE